jgi:hypothetical protein
MPEHRRLPFVCFALALLLGVPTAAVAQPESPEFPDFRDVPMVEITTSSATDLVIFLQGKPENLSAGRDARFKVTATDADGILIKDAVLDVDYGDDSTSSEAFKGRATLVHSWKQKGNYKIKFKITESNGAVSRGTYRVKIHKPLRLFVEIIGDDKPTLDEKSKYRFLVMQENARRVNGTLSIDWGDGTAGTVEDFSKETTQSHTYRFEGDYVIKAKILTNLGESKKARPFPVEASEAGSQLDLSRASIAANAAQDIANFRQTSTVTSVTVTRSLICIFHTKSRGWPVRGGLEGNPWIATFLNGKLFAATYEWLRPGQTCKGIDSSKYGGTAKALGPHIGAGPLVGYVPKKGDVVYFFVSTLARLQERSSNERSDVWEFTWPY